MPEAARVGDPIAHSAALGGLIAGAVIGGLVAVAIVGTGGLAAVAPTHFLVRPARQRRQQFDLGARSRR